MSLADFIASRRVDHRLGGTHHHVSSGYIGVDCPDCSPGSGKYRLGFNIDRGFATCWVCGPKRPAFAYLARVAKCSESEARRVLRSDRTLGAPKRTLTHRGTYAPPKAGALLAQHKRYLRGRGFDPAELETLWKIQGLGRDAGRLAWRVLIPIFLESKPVSWTTRSITDSGQRYLSAPSEKEAVPHKHLLYGEDYCGLSVIVVEGPFDVWKIGPGAVCVFGTTLSDEQVSRLSRFPYRYVCLDAQPSGQKAAERLCRQLATLPGETYNVVLESGKDPSRASEKELRKLKKLIK